jgi:nucleoside 2-deoxyribosyltransferase
MMEIGYAYAIGKPIILVIFNQQAINLMLAESPIQILSPSQLLHLNFNMIKRSQYIGDVK